jgi:hypothetical protein
VVVKRAGVQALRQVVGRPPPTLIPALLYEFLFLILPQVRHGM